MSRKILSILFLCSAVGLWSARALSAESAQSVHNDLKIVLHPSERKLSGTETPTVAHAADMRLFDLDKKKEMKLSEALQGLLGKKIVLVGEQLAWKKGIPERIKERSSLTYAVLLPEIPDDLDKGTVTLEDADHLILGASKD